MNSCLFSHPIIYVYFQHVVTLGWGAFLEAAQTAGEQASRGAAAITGISLGNSFKSVLGDQREKL